MVSNLLKLAAMQRVIQRVPSESTFGSLDGDG
jgi:hypothetical protein